MTTIRSHINYGNAKTDRCDRVQLSACKPRRPYRSKPDADTVARYLIEFAQKGLRCPTREQMADAMGADSWKTMTELRRAGRLRIEIYGHNYRVVEIDGHRTKAHHGNKPPFRVLDQTGEHWVGK